MLLSSYCKVSLERPWYCAGQVVYSSLELFFGTRTIDALDCCMLELLREFVHVHIRLESTIIASRKDGE